MALPPTIERFLSARYVNHDVVEHAPTESPRDAARAAYLAPGQIMRAQVLRDRRGLVVAVCPADHELDLTALNRNLDRDLAPLHLREATKLFADCAPDLVPVLAAAYGLKVVIAPGSNADEDVYFEATHTHLIRMRRGDLERLQNAWHVPGMSRPHRTDPPADLQRPSPAQIRARLERTEHLPPMPEMGQRILQLRANPYADLRELARIVELDPSLAAQVVRFARSPLFGYQGSISTPQDGIALVLGYDLTMNLLLGISVGRAFHNPNDGPLGLHAFWRHAVYTGSLTQLLGRSIAPALRPKPGLAQLCGMLHNFGVLLLGDLFPAEFYWLNRQMERPSSPPLRAAEHRLLGIDHTEMGTLLMQHWKMPPEVIVAVREHHDDAYEGVHAVYANLPLLANRLLYRVGMGDGESAQLPEQLLARYGLSVQQAEQVLTSVLESGPTLDSMAAQMAA